MRLKPSSPKAKVGVEPWLINAKRDSMTVIEKHEYFHFCSNTLFWQNVTKSLTIIISCCFQLICSKLIAFASREWENHYTIISDIGDWVLDVSS